jgi:predicted transcriptional regulator
LNIQTCETPLKITYHRLSIKEQPRGNPKVNFEIETSPKRRDKLKIIAQIIETAKEPTQKTQIMYKANLSFEQLNEYLEFMTNLDLLEKLAARRRELYRATHKGAEFAVRYDEIAQLLRVEEGKNGIKVPPESLLKRKT